MEGTTVNTYVTENGLKITAEMMNPGMKIASLPEDDRIMVGGKDFKKLVWNDLFDGKKVNKLFADYAPVDKSIVPFVPDPEKPAESIGMWMCVTDDVTGRSHSGIITRNNIGSLLIVMFVAIDCCTLTDKRGHKYTVSTLGGSKPIYDNFVERVAEETTEDIRNILAFQGGMLDMTVSLMAGSPRKVFEYIGKIV